MTRQERIKLLTIILMEFDGQRILIESAVKKIEELYFNDPLHDSSVPEMT